MAGEGVAPLFRFNEGSAEEKSVAKYESDCIESDFTISTAAVLLSQVFYNRRSLKTHLEAEALHGFLLVVSQSRTRAGVSSPRVPSWPGWMEEWSHSILPLQT